MKKLISLLLLIAVSSLPLFASSEDLSKGGVASVNATQSLIDLNGEHLIIVNDGNSKIYFQINGGGVLTTVTTADISNQSETSEKETSAATSGSETASPSETTAQPVDPAAQQIIEVVASGGYSPKKIDAKADVPTILIMKSEGAYGCERAFNIPDLGISEILPENGQTQFDLGTHAKGTKLLGVCGMGMYYFQIFFN